MLVIFNPSFKKDSTIKLKIDSPNVKVLNENNKQIDYDVFCYNSD